MAVTLRSLALAIHDYSQRHGARPARVTMAPAAHDALLEIVFGPGRAGTDLTNAIGMDIHLDHQLRPDEVVFALADDSHREGPIRLGRPAT